MSLTLHEFANDETSCHGEMFNLPLCHTTSEKHLSKILHSKALKAQKICPHFKEPLVFFFYGRAEYMPRADDEDEYRVYAPVTFLFLTNKMLPISPKRMLPFDSGAFHQYKFQLEIENFVVPDPTEHTFRTYVKKVFGSKEGYYEPKMTVDTSVYPLLYPLKEIKRIYNRYKGGDTDGLSSRAFTVEVQFADNGKDSVSFKPFRVFLPFKLYTELSNINQLEKFFPGMEIGFYGDGSETDISDKYRTMRKAVKDYITDNKFD